MELATQEDVVSLKTQLEDLNKKFLQLMEQVEAVRTQRFIITMALYQAGIEVFGENL